MSTGHQYLAGPYAFSFSVTVDSSDGAIFTPPTDWHIEVVADDKQEAEQKAYDAIQAMCRDVELEQVLKNGDDVDGDLSFEHPDLGTIYGYSSIEDFDEAVKEWDESQE